MGFLELSIIYIVFCRKLQYTYMNVERAPTIDIRPTKFCQAKKMHESLIKKAEKFVQFAQINFTFISQFRHIVQN